MDEIATLTTSRLFSRLCIFQPSTRPKPLKKEYITPYGSVEIDGRLGQRHADLLEAILHNASFNDGTYYVIDLYTIKKLFGGCSNSYIEKIIHDWLKVVLTIRTKKGGWLKIHAVEKAAFADNESFVDIIQNKLGLPPLKNHLTKKERYYYIIKLTPEFSNLINEQPISYNPTPLIKLKYGITKALARYVLTHKSSPRGGWKLDDLLLKLAVMLDKNHHNKRFYLRKCYEALKKESEFLTALGVKIDFENKRIFKIDTTTQQPVAGAGNFSPLNQRAACSRSL